MESRLPQNSSAQGSYGFNALPTQYELHRTIKTSPLKLAETEIQMGGRKVQGGVAD